MNGNWWEPEVLPAPIRNYLYVKTRYQLRFTAYQAAIGFRVGVFLAHRHRCQFDVNVPRFLTTIVYSETSQPHPALIEAVYLTACYFTARFHPNQNISRHEEHFLGRARKALNESLAFSDRLLDFIRASNLVGWYLFAKGRFLEG